MYRRFDCCNLKAIFKKRLASFTLKIWKSFFALCHVNNLISSVTAEPASSPNGYVDKDIVEENLDKGVVLQQ